MPRTFPSRFLNAFIVILTIALSSCGGGTHTAGAGGSGIGGTGITTVTGNVSQVVARAPQGDQTLARRVLAGAVRWVSAPANAQAFQLGGIQVFGGGRMTTTDDSGNFVLEDVAPSDNFVLSFVFEDNETITLPIGAVPAGSRARVHDIVVDVEQGFATPSRVEIDEDFNPPGQGGTPPGQGGTPPGQSATPPGQSGTPPGQGGAPPGQDGSPGQSGESGGDNPNNN